MSAENIIAIIAAAIALCTSAAGIIYNLIQNKKAGIQKIILENRITYMYEIRKGFTDFIGLANAAAVKAVKNNSEASKIYYANLFNGYEKIKTYIKPFYDIDRRLLDVLDKTYFCILSMINGETDDETELDKLREELCHNYLTYDWAYWKYIQDQKECIYVNSDDAFDKVYEQFIKSGNYTKYLEVIKRKQEKQN